MLRVLACETPGPALDGHLGAFTFDQSFTDGLTLLLGRADYRCTFSYMSDDAAEKLAIWEFAMKTLHAAERRLEAARRKRSADVYPLLTQVEALRTRADLLLVEAVKAMHGRSSES